MSLAQLIRGKSVPEKFATATVATVATLRPVSGTTVAEVAGVAVASSNYEISPQDAATVAQWTELEKAINQCCNARGDIEVHRKALLADCLREHSGDWGWWISYFNREERKTRNQSAGNSDPNLAIEVGQPDGD